MLAPIITGLGFAAGAAVFSRIRRLALPPFRRLWLYPLTGCSIGAAVVFPFGPMLIVFGMCLLGSVAMFCFELVDLPKLAATDKLGLQESQTHDG